MVSFGTKRACLRKPCSQFPNWDLHGGGCSMNCSCLKLAAKDCDNAQCGDCCAGCPRHPSEECCEICDMFMHECDCTECNYDECWNRIPCDSEYCCTLCGPMCEDCFGNPYMSWSGETYCEICGNGMAIGGNDNSPDEWWSALISWQKIMFMCIKFEQSWCNNYFQIPWVSKGGIQRNLGG